MKNPTKKEEQTLIIKKIERQQEIQQRNPPTSKAWKDASAEIHRLAALLTGKKTAGCARRAIMNEGEKTKEGRNEP